MIAGRLDRKLDIQQKTLGRDSFGGPLETWETVATRYARKVDQGGRSFRNAGTTNSAVTTLFYLRYDATITPRHRVLCEGKIYEILAITEGDGRHKETIVQARVLL